MLSIREEETRTHTHHLRAPEDECAVGIPRDKDGEDNDYLARDKTQLQARKQVDITKKQNTISFWRQAMRNLLAWHSFNSVYFVCPSLITLLLCPLCVHLLHLLLGKTSAWTSTAWAKPKPQKSKTTKSQENPTTTQSALITCLVVSGFPVISTVMEYTAFKHYGRPKT